MNTEEPDTITIEKGIPISNKANRKSKYPMGRMELGDSFLLPIPPDSAPDKSIILRSACYVSAKRHGIKVQTRCEYDADEKVIGIRCHRVA